MGGREMINGDRKTKKTKFSRTDFNAFFNLSVIFVFFYQYWLILAANDVPLSGM